MAHNELKSSLEYIGKFCLRKNQTDFFFHKRKKNMVVGYSDISEISRSEKIVKLRIGHC